MCFLGPLKQLLLLSSSSQIHTRGRPKQTKNISLGVYFSLSQIICCEFDFRLLPCHEEKLPGVLLGVCLFCNIQGTK